jgi:hypothetical protein
MSMLNEHNERRNEYFEQSTDEVIGVYLTPDVRRRLNVYAKSMGCSIDAAAVDLIKRGLATIARTAKPTLPPAPEPPGTVPARLPSRSSGSSRAGAKRR